MNNPKSLGSLRLGAARYLEGVQLPPSIDLWFSPVVLGEHRGDRLLCSIQGWGLAEPEKKLSYVGEIRY